MMIEKAVLFNLKVSAACSWFLTSNNAQCYPWLQLPKSLKNLDKPLLISFTLTYYNGGTPSDIPHTLML